MTKVWERLFIGAIGDAESLPDADITVCGGFSALRVGCCDICHTDPLHGMKLPTLKQEKEDWDF
jgi:hypothetical protein